MAESRGTLVNTTLDPSRPEDEIVDAVLDWFRTARASRNPMIQTWQRCYNALRVRRHTPTGSPNVRLPEIFPIVRSSVGWKMDQRIVTHVSPAAPLGVEWRDWLSQRCSDMETTLLASAQVNGEEMELEKMLWDADTYGTGMLKTTWDDTLAGGLGDGMIRRVSPWNLYPDPAATNEDDADFIVEARYMSVQELDRRFPGKGKLFVRGGGEEAIDEAPNQLGAPSSAIPRAWAPTPGAVSPNTNPIWSRSTDPTGPQHHTDPVVVLECWLREHTVRNGLVRDGWRVIVIAGRHVLLNERAEDIWLHGWHPYNRYVPHDLGEFWGIGLVELLGPIQAALNRIVGSVQTNIELTGNPIMLEDFGALTQGDFLSATKPGGRLSKRSQKEVRWMEPPSLHPNIGELIQFLLERMKVISGLSDLSQGNLQGRPAQETAGMLAEAQFISIRSQLINLEHTLSGAYRKKVALVAENYTEPRWLSTIGPDGQETPLLLDSRHFMRPTNEGAVPLEYLVRVEAGSASHTSRKVREDRAITLFTLGAMDIMTLLETLDIPNPQNILRRLGEQQASILAGAGPNTRQKARA